MSRHYSEATRTSPLREQGDVRVRLATLLGGLSECARELERGAAMQPASEELLAARRAVHGTPLVQLRGSGNGTVQNFLRSTLSLHSSPGVALESLPGSSILHMGDGETRRWRLLVQSSAGATAPVGPAYLRLQLAPRSPDSGDTDWECAAELASGIRADHLLPTTPAEFWSAALFTDAALVDALRAQSALSLAATALDTLRRRIQLQRQEHQLTLSLLKIQEPRRTSAGTKSGGDSALRLVSDAIAELVGSVRERARRAATRGSWLWSFQANALSQISRESIARDERRRITRLAVNEEQIRGIEASFLRTFRGMLSKELEALRSEIDGLCRAVEKQLELAPRSMVYEFPNDQALWNDVAGYAVVDVRYRGEIQRRGFMERLAEGRKVVFLLLMVGSLAGSFIGFNLRQSGLIGLACLVLFVGTIAWSYKSWSDEENELIDRETDKLTDLVEAAIIRATSDSLREAGNCIVSALEGVRKQLLARIESSLDRNHRQTEARLADELRDHQARLARADAGLRQLAALEPPLQRHAQTIEVLTAELARQLPATLRGEGGR